MAEGEESEDDEFEPPPQPKPQEEEQPVRHGWKTATTKMISAIQNDDLEEFVKWHTLSAQIMIQSLEVTPEELEQEKKRLLQPTSVFRRWDDEGFTVFHHILLNSSVKIFKYVLDNITDWTNVDEEALTVKFNSYRLIHLACMPLMYEKYERSASEIISLMVDHKELMQDKLINKCDRLGNTPLHLVAWSSNSSSLIDKVLTMPNIDPK